MSSISVYITSYNQKQYLPTAVDSVLNQTLLPAEIIIVDDFSTDGSVELIKSYCEEYPKLIRPIFHEVNKGVTQSRIDAIHSATSELITYVDGDDFYEREKLEIELKLLHENNADLVFSNFYRVNTNSMIPESIWTRSIDQLPQFGNMHKSVLVRNFPSKMLFRCELVKKSLLLETGLHDGSLKIYEDFDLKIRLSEKAKICYTLKPLHFYRDNDKGLSKSNKSKHNEALSYIYKKYQNYLLVKYPEDNKLHAIIAGRIRRYDGSENKSVIDQIKSKIIRLLKLYFPLR